MKNRFLTGAAMVLAIFLLMAPGMARAGDEKIHITFWHALGGYREEIIGELVDRFNKENPGIQVEAVYVKSRDPRLGNDYHALYRKIMVNLAQKTPPDVAQVYENWTAQWIDIGALIPTNDSNEEDLIPIFRHANTFDGELWTLPFNKSIYVLYYNADLFHKAGVEPPGTWEEFRQVAMKLTGEGADGARVYGIAFRPSVDIFGHYLLAKGGSFIEDNRAVFSSPAGVEVLKFWTDLVHKDRSAHASFNDREDFARGRSAMYIDTTSRLPSMIEKTDFQLGVVPLPRGTHQRYQFAGTNLAIFSHLSGERLQAARKFVRFMSDTDSTLFLALHTGYLPVRKSAIESPMYQELLKKDPRYQVGISALEYAEVQPKVAAWEMIRGILDDTMFDAISRRTDPDKALDRAQKMANHLIMNLTGKN